MTFRHLLRARPASLLAAAALGVGMLSVPTQLVVPYANAVDAPAAAAIAVPEVYISEVESDADPLGDWVELHNRSNVAVDLSGFWLRDDKDTNQFQFPADTVLAPGEYRVFYQQDRDGVTGFSFGLGKADQVRLFDAANELVDQVSWTSHAPVTYIRDLSAAEATLIASTESTPGAANDGSGTTPGEQPTPQPEPQPEPQPTGGRVIINEINSSPDDFVEVLNIGTATVDLSDYEIRDNSDDHRWRFAEGTTLAPGAYAVVSADSQGLVFNDQDSSYIPGTFGAAVALGSGDSVRLLNKAAETIDSHSWRSHAALDGNAAAATLSRCPNGTGPFGIGTPTPGASNDCVVPAIALNEIESNEAGQPDFAEIINISDGAVDISGWSIIDNDPAKNNAKSNPLPAGTILQPGEFFTFVEGQQFTFGLGKNDEVVLRDASGATVARHAWTEHAAGVLARCPDGTGDWVDVPLATPSAPNNCGSPVVINEVAPAAGWVELKNPLKQPLDISGLVLKNAAGATVAEITQREPVAAGGYAVIELSAALAAADSIELFDGNQRIQSYSWTEAPTHSFGRCPDGTGEFTATEGLSRGTRNACAGVPSLIQFPAAGAVTVVDSSPMFLADSSGLDYADGTLWAVDNGTGKFWKLNAGADGSVTPAWPEPKRARFIADANNPQAAGPDAEGITIAGDGKLYLASERDNSAKGVNYNVILQIDPDAPGPDVVASAQWDLTPLLPQVSANLGIEAVEWVPFSALEGKLVDRTTGQPVSAAQYPQAVAGGVFFVAFEDNGHVYALVLNPDGTATIIADIDTVIGGAMALHWDTLSDRLFVMADDGYDGTFALLTFNGAATPAITHMTRPADMPNVNNEGFALSDQCTDGARPAWFFQDGVSTGALTTVMLADSCEETSPPQDGGNGDGSNDNGGNDNGNGGNGNGGNNNGASAAGGFGALLLIPLIFGLLNFLGSVPGFSSVPGLSSAAGSIFEPIIAWFAKLPIAGWFSWLFPQLRS